MKRTPIQDVFAMVVPARLDMEAPDVREETMAVLQNLAVATTWKQYADCEVMPELEFEEIDWLITKDPADVEAFQPAHDCAACRAGNDQSLAFLRDNPGRYIAMANIGYIEVWP